MSDKYNSTTDFSGGDGEGVSASESEFLSHWTYNKETRRAAFDGSIEVLPSTFYLGEFALSNGVQAVAFKLADGTNALGLVNRYNPTTGTISNPKFFALSESQELPIETGMADIMPDPLELNYTISGNNLTFDFYFVPSESGSLKSEYWIGADSTGNKIFDEIREVSQAEVDAGAPISFSVGNPYLLEAGVDIFVRFSGISLRGNLTTGQPYFISQILPYKEITINGHVEHVTPANNGESIFIGCDYAVDASGGAITRPVPLGFTDKFVAYDYKGAFSNTNKFTIDFSAHGQPNFEMIHKDDHCQFFYIDGDGWYVNDIKGSQIGRVE